MSSPTEEQNAGDAAAERQAVDAHSDDSIETPPKSEFEVGQLPLLLYAFVALLLVTATVSLVT